MLLLSYGLIGCSGANTTAGNTSELESSRGPNAGSSQQIENEHRYPIIEISKELDGSVPIRGTSLFFRMFDDGMV